jgi:RHS repeat-associated protein
MNLLSTQRADSNANAISYDTSTSKWTDTLGVAALTYDSNTYSWTDVNNGSPSITLSASTNYELKSTFACPGEPDYDVGYDLATQVGFPDSTNVGLTWDTTGRLSLLTLRTGGSVTYNYNPNSAAHGGLNCTHFVPNEITRQTSDGTTSYTIAFVTSGGSCTTTTPCSTTTELDPGGNKRVYSFSAGWNATYPVTLVLTQIQTFQNTGTISSPTYSSTATTTDLYCYNASAYNTTPSACATAAVSLPITSRWAYHEVGGSKSSLSETKYDVYGNTTYSAQYDFGATTPTFQTTVTYGTYGSPCTSIGNNINNKPCEVLKQDGSSNMLADSRFYYDSHGNLLKTSIWNGSSYIGQTSNNTYNTNGTVATSYDVANNETTYTYDTSGYSDCGSLSCSSVNPVFPTKIANVATGLYTQSTWDVTGGVKLTDVDASGNTTSYSYAENCGTTADPFWRVGSVTDPLGNKPCTAFLHTSNEVQTSFGFNSGNSVRNTTSQNDSYGRPTNKQVQKGPSSTTYDTVSTSYSWTSPYFQTFTSMPCAATAGTNCLGIGYGATTLYDVLNRPTIVTESGPNGVTTNTYYPPATSAARVDVRTSRGPAPTWDRENTKQVQKEYDGLGRLTISCGILSTGGSSCGEANAASGIKAAYTYTTSAGSSEVQVVRGSQTKTTYTDPLGRVTQSTTPEAGTWNYYYDSVSTPSCPTGYKGILGKLEASKDPNGNLLCYAYDAMGRVTGTNANGTTCRHFYYDGSTGYSGSIPAGVTTPTNPSGRMVEAATDNCSSGTLQADEWFSYDKDGHMTDMWEKTPNSGTYYHSTATFFGNGAINTVKIANPNLYTQTYGLDGEGRPTSMSSSASAGVTVVSSATYNAAGQPTNIAIGTSTDHDGYTYDQDTGRMTGWTFQVGTTPKTQVGVLTWNPIGTLKSLAITDGFYAGATQTCNFGSALNMGYDDLNRLLYDDCGAGGWGQTFSFNDQYGNLTKAVISGRTGTTFNPGYNPANNQFASGFGASYDSNGNLTYDTFHHYEWNEFSKVRSFDRSGTNCATSGQCIVYDALGRMVEIDNGSTKTEILYTQLGKTAYLNGTTLNYAYWPTPGGGTLLQIGGVFNYEHKDWLGNARISSGVLSDNIVDDRAFSPYGELYATFGSTAQNENIFTGDTQDIVSGTYDTPNRELSIVGRWISPDPAGAGWNLYAYSANPNSETDPTGLCTGEGCIGTCAETNSCDTCTGTNPCGPGSWGWGEQGTGCNGPCDPNGSVGSNSGTVQADSADWAAQKLGLSDVWTLDDAMAEVAYSIANFNQLASDETDQIISDYENGKSTPEALQNDLQNYENPPGGLDVEELQVKQGAQNDIKNWVSDQLQKEIIAESQAIVSLSSKTELYAFYGMIEMGNKPSATASAAQGAANYGYGKVIDWTFGKLAWAFNGAVFLTTRAPASQVITDRVEGMITEEIKAP